MMPVQGPFVWTPASLDADGLLGSHGVRVAEGALWIGHLVFEKMATDSRCREAGQVPLQTALLRRIVGRHHLDAARELAGRIGYVHRDRAYRAGNRSQAYSIQEPHIHAPLSRRSITDLGLASNIARWRAERDRENWNRIRDGKTPIEPAVCRFLWENLQRLRIDNGIDVSRSARQVAVWKIRERDFFLIPDRHGRMHSNLTNLPKRLRAFLSVDGLRLEEVDIGECQPLLFGLLLRNGQEGKRGKEKREPGAASSSSFSLMLDKEHLSTDLSNMLDKYHPEELREYLSLCENRKFYQTVADQLGVTRDAVKAHIMTAFFGKPEQGGRTKKILNGMLPNLMKILGAIKRGDHRRLSHLGMRAESEFMFGRVVPRLIRDHPGMFVGTIHDSALTTAGNGATVRNVMLAEFRRLGVSPSIRIESLTPRDR